MSKSGQENRGYTPRNDGLPAGRSTFQAVRAHRHPPSPDSFVRPASVADRRAVFQDIPHLRARVLATWLVLFLFGKKGIAS